MRGRGKKGKVKKPGKGPPPDPYLYAIS